MGENQERPYRVKWSEQAQKNLGRIHPTEKKKIIYKVENILARDPYGKQNNKIKPLKGEVRKDQWRYRSGDYRIIYQIFPTEIYIEVLEVGHRRDIYEER